MKKIFLSGSGSIILAFLAFISLGFPDGLIGVAWPAMRVDFHRSLDSLGFILISSTSGYLISSFFSGKILSYLGVGWLLTLSCFATGIALVGFGIIPFWWIIVGLALLGGSGAGAIDAGINTFIEAHYGARLMQWLHASFGIGITISPVIMTFGISYANSWELGYLIVGISQLALATCFGFTHSIWNDTKPKKTKEVFSTTLFETIKQSKVWLSIFLFFIYSGVEASVGSWSYTLFTESRNIEPQTAGFWVASYWGSFTLGRILAGFFTKNIGMSILLKRSFVLAIIGLIMLIFNPFTYSNFIAVLIIGFSIAPIFPGMLSLTSLRVGDKFTSHTIGMQISAAGLGFALIPTTIGIIAQRTSLEIIPYLILFAMIIFSVFYLAAMRKSKAR